VSVVHQIHLVNVTVVAEREFGECFPHREIRLDIDWRLMVSTAERSGKSRPRTGILTMMNKKKFDGLVFRVNSITTMVSKMY
jgi:hypothetical protein